MLFKFLKISYILLSLFLQKVPLLMFDRVLSLRLKFTVMDIPALLNYFGTAPSKHATGDLLVGFFITRIGKLL